MAITARGGGTLTGTVTLNTGPATCGQVATLGSLAKSVTLTVQPNVSFSVSLSPSTVKGGATSTLTVKLAAASPAGGLTFALSSNNASVVSFQPSTITIAAGQTTGMATVDTTKVTSNASAIVTATLGSTAKTATLKVTP